MTLDLVQVVNDAGPPVFKSYGICIFCMLRNKMSFHDGNILNRVQE